MKLEKLQQNHHYHIYNRGIDGILIFKSDENKRYFLSLISKYLKESVKVYSYCLMDNHFHLAVEILDENKVTQAFSNFFNAYAKAFNKQQGRTGSLFEKHFKRKRIDSEVYLKSLIIYIHKNPENHKIAKQFQDYKFSSYQEIISKKSNFVASNEVISMFDDLDNFIHAHIVDNPRSFQNDLQGFQNLVGLNNNESDTYKVSKTLQEENESVKDKFYTYIQELQDTITSKLEEIDGKAKFHQDIWKRAEGGGGRTRVIENGNVFEKGGVNISAVHGKLPETMQNYFGVKDADFFACGLSLVLHPKNPFVPTVHANWRYFEMYNQQGEIVDSWFGGGQDLTPYYLFEEDATHFHQVCKTSCDKHHPDFYEKYKERCDEYFYNSHRGEARGIGGLFFDYCKKSAEMTMQNWYDFVTEVGNSFLEAYVPIVERRKDIAFSEAHRNWQEIRRGRYVEFNLVHDKGTLFGLKTNGRIESILMSLPPHVQWLYNHHPEKGSEEEKLLEVLKNPKDWT